MNGNLNDVTSVVRINMAEEGDNLPKTIDDACNARHAIGYLLSSSFSYSKYLVLIFQKPLQ